MRSARLWSHSVTTYQTPCLPKVNQSGRQGNYPAGDTGWGTEASLDIDMVSAICPLCHILVVEAGDLDAAQNTAVSLGERFISNSSGTGDGSQNSGTARGWSESAWSGSGAGCSSWEAKPSWQTDSGCGRRTVADVSSGSDGSCSPSYLCTSGSGYDGPTGLGTPNGLGAFQRTGSGATGGTGPVASGVSGKCLDDPGFSSTNGTQLDIRSCDGGGNQHWTLP